MTAIALDTNVLAYADGLERAATDATKVVQSRELMRILVMAHARVVTPLQALAELQHVLVRRDGRTPLVAGKMVERWTAWTETVATDGDIFAAAMSLAGDHGLQIFDAIILAGAAAAACNALLSEDLHDGFVWRGVEVINPFGASGKARLDDLVGP